ncbi:hypothetical protein MAPG_02462 [Magnaporthiopsis poae ATCC 64411]|uniref:Zinc finger PHD-type domain-containing protein n=1 Tax=Magnaporthiopsis poae (strain ATCC 64411 / 73-15) TaxID=644358 RepID=A0A0C4DRF6_MAGP6|nr:hypothetical protein MAPG_02462 [Magnaporthiopsis poae ATCC 64411]
MGESDTRRSSRARTAQSQPQAPSSSSSTSGRAERTSRSSTNKTSSPQLTTPAPSTSASEPPDDASVNGTETAVRTLRSRARDSNNSDRDRAAAASADSADMASSENEMQDDDESVRCICGFDEYPGPPVLKDDAKNPSKDAADIDPFLAADVPDEVAGFFLQCDVCKVWQHGGCVGILNAASSPEEYFCEECRKDLHKISTASNGQRYSHYLPVSRQSRSTSRQTAPREKEGAKSPKQREARSGKSAPALASSKRRSTLNSRGVYDEEEELRRAIEASKEDAPPDEQDSAGSRRPKRGRSNSEEKPEATKRQRTGSISPSPPDESAIQDDSDDAPVRNGSTKNKARIAVVRSQREKTEKEEREKQKVEAANKRKSRAERRRAEDSDPSEETPLATRVVVRSEIPPPPPPPRNVSPPQPTPDKPEKNATSKAKKQGSRKKGRNQYTKDRDRSPGRSQSRDVPDHGAGSANSRPRNARSHAKQDKDKDMSWIDMERRIAYWTDFAQRVEQDIGIDREPAPQDKSSENKEAEKENDSSKETEKEKDASVNGDSASTLLPPAGAAPVNGGSPLKNVVVGLGAAGKAPTIAITNGETSEEKKKKESDMNIHERLDFIKNRIKSWHTTYGVETRS